MPGHYRCCCLVCNPKDTEPPTCGTCPPHEKSEREKKPKKSKEADSE